MAKIRILDRDTASKIAAGEVVERPASVVKELVENSLDAGASSVAVYLAEGGRRMMRVVDDGSGMSEEDARIAFMRHSTSKVSTEDDLWAIRTLGFRGEALASISTVSRVTLKTRERGTDAGTSVVIEGGSEPEVSPAGCPEGTSIEIKDLFFNTPARLKFLRSAASEYGRVADVVKRAALINPDKRFTLVHGSSRKLDLKGGDLRERIAEIFGRQVADSLIEVSDPFITGFIGTHELTYSTARELYIFINGRPVRDRSVNKAIIDAYGTLIERSRYPFAVLDLRVPFEDVDVNMHPAKSEVRFRKTSFVYDMVKAALRGALAGPEAPSPRTTEGARRDAGISAGVEERFSGLSARETSTGYGPARSPGLDLPPPAAPGRNAATGEAGARVRNPEFLELTPVGQLWGEFLVAERTTPDGEGEYYIIDQHGAEERSAFEELKRACASGGRVKSQMLLLPERVETTPEERDALTGSLEVLERFGFEITPFGPSARLGGETFLVKSVPHLLQSRGAAPLIKDLAEELSELGGSSRLDESMEAALMRIACHSVIRGPRTLSREEGTALLRKLASIDFAGHCPHGRPVVKRHTRRELEAFFKR